MRNYRKTLFMESGSWKMQNEKIQDPRSMNQIQMILSCFREISGSALGMQENATCKSATWIYIIPNDFTTVSNWPKERSATHQHLSSPVRIKSRWFRFIKLQMRMRHLLSCLDFWPKT